MTKTVARQLSLFGHRLTFHWAPRDYAYGRDDEFFTSNVPPPTEPAHDVVHLVIAAHGTMPWRPTADRTQTCFAEYNAVLLENFYVKARFAAQHGLREAECFTDCLSYMKWFVETHYKPFPVCAADALGAFLAKIDPTVASNLFPYYLNVKQASEAPAEVPGEFTFDLEFGSDDVPVGDEACRKAQTIIKERLEEVATWHSPSFTSF